MSRRPVCAAIAAGLIASSISQSASAEPHYSKAVEILESTISECYFFRLAGVSQSDPVTPNSPWFAIHKDQAQAKDMVALLITARVTGMNLQRVVTNGSVVCGHAQVQLIDF